MISFGSGKILLVQKGRQTFTLGLVLFKRFFSLSNFSKNLQVKKFSRKFQVNVDMKFEEVRKVTYSWNSRKMLEQLTSTTWQLFYHELLTVNWNVKFDDLL